MHTLLLRPGRLVVPLRVPPGRYCLDEQSPTVKYDYFATDVIVDETVGTYADLDAVTAHNLSYEWPHSLPQLFEALLGVGFQLRFFHEWDHTLFQFNSLAGQRRRRPLPLARTRPASADVLAQGPEAGVAPVTGAVTTPS